MRLVLALAAVARLGTAQGAGTPCPVPADDARPWTPPLDRVVTQGARGIALRTALDQVAARAGVRLSYSSELLPLDREACTVAVAAPLGTVLRALLHDVAVRPLPGGATQVVLAPGRPLPPLAARTATLDRVVVTGSTAGAPQRGLPYALDVVTPREARGAAAPSLAQALDGVVPGLWIWNDAPTTLHARYASIRGASSFGVSAPKVFVDGIELANPLLLTRLAGEAVERIEVIRGPQGAALYGADAISGVIHVQLRHDGAADGRREASVRSGAGAVASRWAAGGTMQQEHLVALRAGSTGRAVGAVVAANAIGGVVPGADALQVSADASARRVGRTAVTTGIASLRLARADTPVNPLLADVAGAIAGAPVLQGEGRQALAHYTVGSTTTMTPDPALTHQVTVGLDGYRLSGMAMDLVPVPSAVDSALRETQGGADRASLRASSVRRLRLGETVGAAVTVTGDVAMLRDATTSVVALRQGGLGAPGFPSAVRWLGTVGAGVQGGLAWREALFVTAGLRGERNDGFTNASRFALLPAIGASVVREAGPLTLKLRVAYGEGQRPARTPMREAAWQGWRVGALAADLAPERQAGVEAGVDLVWGQRLVLQVTRFDQRASSLIQQVPVGIAPAPLDPRVPYAGRRLAWQLEDVGAITNRGWELGARTAWGAVAVQGTLSLVQSRVAQVAPAYAGDLRAGDRMLNVPARTAGLTVTWQPRAWQLQAGVTHVADWIGYDRLGVASDYLGGDAPARSLTGAALRAYWLRYGGVTRLRATLARDLGAGFALRLTGDNLLGTQRGEPDNTTIVPGRSVGVGLLARF